MSERKFKPVRYENYGDAIAGGYKFDQLHSRSDFVRCRTPYPNPPEYWCGDEGGWVKITEIDRRAGSDRRKSKGDSHE